ncbi:MAG: hypothetical protein PVG94_09610 [Gammaproteobacteria bacterium]|jgi:hypothetical protein
MKLMHKDLFSTIGMPIFAVPVTILFLVISACTSQQYYEGLKAGHRANCLEYPEAEYKDCIEEADTGFEEYKNQREEVIGN